MAKIYYLPQPGKYRNNKGRFCDSPLANSQTMIMQIPFEVRQRLNELIANQGCWPPDKICEKREQLQRICPHLFVVEHEEVTERKPSGYIKICLICGKEEQAKVAVDIQNKEKKIFLYKLMHQRPLLVTRRAGSFTLMIFCHPPEEVFEKVIEYKRSYSRKKEA